MKRKLSILIFIISIFINCSNDEIIKNNSYNHVDLLNGGIVILSEEDKIILENDNVFKVEHEILSKTTSYSRLLAHETRLKYFAQALAASLDNQEVINILITEVMKKFDGDTEVLWDMVNTLELSDKFSLREYINSKFIRDNNSPLSISEIEKVPLLNIRLISNCENCIDVAGNFDNIRVAYFPITKNDIEVDSVVAYDSELNEYMLSNFDCPEFPLVVVDVNERVDPVSQVLKYSGLNKTTMISGYSEGYCLIFNEAYLYDDKEPCTKGAAEIYFRVYAYDSNGNLIDDDTPEYEHMNHDNSDYECHAPGANLGHWTWDSNDPDYAGWLASYFFDTDNMTEPATCKIVIWEDDTIDDDRIERYWSLTDGEVGSIIIPWPSYDSFHWYYGGGNSGDCDLKIKSWYHYPY